MRDTIIAGNWKMNKNFREGTELVGGVLDGIHDLDLHRTHVVFAPPFIHLRKVHKDIRKHKNLHVAAQNCHWEESGAFTGEVSVPMLESVGCEYAIVGHSERRQFFYESNDICARKISAVLKAGLKPIYCVGETLDVRDAKRHFTHVELQVVEGLFHLKGAEIKNLVVAYEPVWAIGTGVTASAGQAQEMHAFIRKALAQQYGDELAARVPILYGGSLKPSNAAELLGQPDVDGGLIGGASLQASDFVSIIRTAAALKSPVSR